MSSSLSDAYRMLHDGALALAACERVGISVDVDYCRARITWLDDRFARADRRLRASELGRAWTSRFGSGASFGSGKQLQAVLYADLGVKPFKQTETEQDSVDEESLRQTGVGGIDHLLRQRSVKKVRDVLAGFLRYQVDGRLHPSFHLHTVRTFRSSSSEPNLQNVPKRDKWQMGVCRRAIVPSPGNVVLEIDLKAIEVGVAACYHKDPTMLAYLRDPASDMHADVAKEAFFLKGKIAALKRLDGFSATLRQAAKNGFVFPEFYGDYYERCAQNMACSWLKLPRLGDWSETDGMPFDGRPIAAHLIASGVTDLAGFTEHVKGVERRFWQDRFPVYYSWRQDWYARYQRRGSFRMKTGFVCSGAMRRNEVVNYPVQGAAFHILLKMLTLIVRGIKGWRSRAVGEIHDSILLDAHPDDVPALVEMVRGILSDEIPRLWPWVCVPLQAEAAVSAVDGNWAEMKDVK